jgi:hypothetical protein
MFDFFKKIFNKSSKTPVKNTVEPAAISKPEKVSIQPQQEQINKYSNRFNNFIKFVFDAECVYAKGHYGDLNFVITETVLNDAGGTTKFGIDAASHPGVDIKNLTINTAKDIYFKEWKEANIEQYDYPLGECVYDCNVNCGAGRTKKILAVSGKDVEKFLKERAAFYHRLVESTPKNKKFLNGWLNRLQDLCKYLNLNVEI